MPTLQKAIGIARTLAAYAATYARTGEGSEETAEQAHAARKAAIESLIETLTDRSDRGGEWVVSIGASVGFSAVGWQDEAEEGSEWGLYSAQLSLPMGLAVQWLPEREDGCGWAKGFHLLVPAIDLGQFLSFDGTDGVKTPAWNAFLGTGLQLGWLFGYPADAFILGFEYRYAPQLVEDEDFQHVHRLGFFVGYSVPFLDLN